MDFDQHQNLLIEFNLKTASTADNSAKVLTRIEFIVSLETKRVYLYI